MGKLEWEPWFAWQVDLGSKPNQEPRSTLPPQTLTMKARVQPEHMSTLSSGVRVVLMFPPNTNIDSTLPATL